MAGWIKINRDIVSHWIWQDAERLKWWLDLLFLANWEDKQVMHDTHLFTLRKGQIIASLSYLCDRWHKSKPTVINYLKLLEQEGMIDRQTLYRQTPIITICNYDRYQSYDDNVFDTQIDTIVDTIVDTQIDTNKENKEYNNNYYNVRAHVREMNGEEQWCELMMMRHHLAREQLTEWLSRFELDAQCRAVEHQNLSDAKRHFCDWLRIQLEKQHEHQETKTDKRRGCDTSAKSWEDYTTSF
jgi:hypothetical protein